MVKFVEIHIDDLIPIRLKLLKLIDRFLIFITCLYIEKMGFS